VFPFCEKWCVAPAAPRSLKWASRSNGHVLISTLVDFSIANLCECQQVLKKEMNSTSKPTKSARTREAIMTAARDLFGERGFERTTVRDIASVVGVDPALVIRYFGSKDQLFAQASEFRLNLPDLKAVDPGRTGEALVRHYLSIWEGESGDAGLPILLRSAASNEEAAEQMREIFRTQVLPVVRNAARGRDVSARAALIASQLLGLAFCRYILKLPPIVAMSSETLVRDVGRTVQAYLDGAPA